MMSTCPAVRTVPACILVVFFYLLPGAAAAETHPPTFNDQARFLAGLSVSPESPLAAMTGTSAWKEHASGLQYQWDILEKKRLTAMRDWAQKELKPALPHASVLFYLFSGPDFVSADTLFPGMPVYVLAGLEPIGSIRFLDRIKPENLSVGLRVLGRSLRSIVNLSFFRTLDMQTDFQNPVFPGVLPVLYIFLSRTGNEVVEVHGITIDGEGKIVEAEPAPRGVKGVRIRFRRQGASEVQVMYYLEANLGDYVLSRNNGVLKFLGSQGKGASYLKAASYLLHKPYFSRVRTFLLDHSVALLEDDSGIPARFFDDARWMITLFGSYLGVIDLFKEYYQPALKELYAGQKAEAIPFATGYTFARKSNMLLAVSKAALPAVSDEVQTGVLMSRSQPE